MDFSKILDTSYKIITIIIGLGGLIALVIGWCRGWFKFIKNFNKTSKTINAFSDKILPKALQGCEEKGILPKGTLAEWSEILSSGFAPVHSPRELNESGAEMLENSGIKKIIDDNLEKFITSLEQKKLKTPLDIEEQCFYVLKEQENTEIINPIKTYLYKNPNQEINAIFFVGSIYLRNKYKERHPDLFE